MSNGKSIYDRNSLLARVKKLEPRAQTRNADDECDIDMSRSDLLVPDMLVDYTDPVTKKRAVRRESVHLDVAVVESGCNRAILHGSAKVRGVSDYRYSE